MSSSWPRRLLLLAWAASVLVFGAVAHEMRRSELAAALDEDARALQRLVSQRADQHDAHLTAVAALAAGLPEAREPLHLVADGILRFYPRLVAVDVRGSDAARSFTTRDTCAAGSPCAEALVRAAAVAQDGTPRPVAGSQGRYLLAKRIGEGVAAQVVALEVDAARLLERGDESRPAMPGDTVTLFLPDGTPLLPVSTDAPPSLVVLAQEVILGSTSQRLRLRLERRPPVGTLVPWVAMAGYAIGSASLLGFALALRRSRGAARAARRRAELGEHAARLAHAGRVNALGEMASGIAHELTQPLTALLAQSQAALRLARRGGEGDQAALERALDANVRAARRAGDILSRLRGWASKDLPPPCALDLNAVVRAGAEIDQPEAEARGIALSLDLAEPAPVALAEPVQAEQVVHNLLRNAREAMEANPPGAPRRITLRTRAVAAGGGEIVVEDTGPGLAPDVRARLFEPFFTTKAAGMGLGLSLCRTMVEQMGGRIEAGEAEEGQGARFVVRLPPVPA